VAAISLATPWASPRVFDKWFSMPNLLWLSPLPLLTAAAFAGIARAVARLQAGRSNADWLPFVLAVWVFVFAFAGLAYSLYPYLVIDRLTIWQAAAAEKSLRFVLVGTLIVLPFVVGYTLLSYRVFWGKARALTYGE
jgi:cytochrome d ubiquinol oxidase subunit II